MAMVTTGQEHAFEAKTEAEADPFLPLILPLAAKALPAIGRAVLSTIRRLPPDAGRGIGSAVGSLFPGPSGKADGRASPAARRARGHQTALRLVCQLHKPLARGEAEAASAEAALFGTAEQEFESSHPGSDAALTEVLPRCIIGTK